MKMREILDRFASLLFPQTCVLCGTVVEYDTLWCGECLPHLLKGEVCAVCGHLQADCVCGRVQWAFVRAVSALRYKGSVREAVLRLKKKPDRRICLFFAQQMQEVLAEEYAGIVFDCAVEVPQNPKKLAERGYNPAELLAAELCVMLGLPLERCALCRLDSTRPQHSLDVAARFANAQSSFKIARKEAVKGKHILLIDDVMTTGATAQACAAALLGAGALTVHVVTAAATGHREK